jgi:hypothetical protein
VSCNVVFGTGFFDKRLNHYSVRTTDGERHTSDLGPTLCVINILAKNISTAQKEALDEWMHNIIVYTKLPFSIYQFKSSGVTFSTGSGVDLGLGVGVTITGVRYTKDNTEGVFSLDPPDRWSLNLEGLEFIR